MIAGPAATNSDPSDGRAEAVDGARLDPEAAGPRGRTTERSALRAMLEARSVAVVGASPRPDSFGERVLTELTRSPSRPEIHLVNPKYAEVGGLRCVASLEDLRDPVDLVLMCVGDTALPEQFRRAAARGDRSAVVYGSAVDVGDPFGEGTAALRQGLVATARRAGMEVCGGGCMGFVNAVTGLRAIGYLEPSPLPAGPVGLVTHSGSAFSALLRADRRIGWSLAVSSGQELVTSTARYIDYMLGGDETEVIALLLETLRDPAPLRSALARAAAKHVPVVALTVGGSPGGQAMVAAHSGALAGNDATWEALCEAHGVLRVPDLSELVDTIELLAAGRRPRPRSPEAAPTDAVPTETAATEAAPTETAPRRPTGGLAAVLDSGAERALVVDVAEEVGVGFSPISQQTRDRLAALLDPGLLPENPLDVWGTGDATRELFASSLIALAEDPSVDVVALCVDLIPELDGDTAYVEALIDAFEASPLPLCLITNLPSALDRRAARRLRDAGIPVLEGTRSGLRAVRHLLEQRDASLRPAIQPAPLDPERQARWRHALAGGPLSAVASFAMIRDYGLQVPAVLTVSSKPEALEAAESIGWPVVLKTDEPGIAHKTDAGGVVLDLSSAESVARAYEDMASRLGPRALVMPMAETGTELSLGLVRDPLVGPVVVLAAGGVLVEVLADRVVALPPLDDDAAMRLIDRLAVATVLRGVRGRPPADLKAVAAAVAGVAQIAVELGECIEALDVNPLSCSPEGALALDVLVEVSQGS